MSADLFQVLGDPRRRQVIALVAARERTAGEIAERFDVTRQAVSHHLRVLLEAGLVQERREGARRWYRWPRDACATTPPGCPGQR